MSNTKDPSEFLEHHIQGSAFMVPKRYSNLQALGMGSQGHVCSANDAVKGKQVAIKKILHPFQDAEMTKRVYREIKLLKHVRHETIIGVVDMFLSPKNDIYLVFEKADWNLKEIIDMNLEEKQIKHLFYQILYGLKFLHQSNIAHRDLKPSNILVTKSGHIKIADFGLARVMETAAAGLPLVTGYVVTRFYRAPEVVLHWQSYQKSIDLWSAGCILAEMLTGTVLFAGHSPIDQFRRITEDCGKPSPEIIATISDEQTAKYVQNLPNYPRILLSQKYPQISPVAADLLDKIFVYDPEKRISATEALHHPYFQELPYPREDGSQPKEFDWSFKLKELSLSVWRELIIREVESFGETPSS